MRQKRFLSWIMVFTLLVGMFSFPAYAEGNTSTISGDGTADKTGTMTITLVIPKKTPAATDLSYTAPSDLTYSGSDKVATVQAASGITGMGNITVKYYSDASRTTEAAPKNVGTYYVGATVAEGDQYAASTAVLYGDGWTFEITKSTPTAPDAPTKASATKNSITLNAVSGCEYSKDGTNWQSGTEFAGLLPGTEYTFYQRVKATANTNASTASSAKFSTEADTYAMTITLTIKEMKVSAEDVSVAYDGQPHGITVNVTDPASDYTVKFGTTEGTYDLDASPTQTEVGTQTIYYQVTANNYVTKTGSATVTINKADAVAATVTANNRTYDGTDKPLVTVTGEATGGEMQYALGTATEATGSYTTSIPAKTDAGTYYVWYKVKGDGNHNDTEPKPISVTISNPAPSHTHNWGDWEVTKKATCVAKGEKKRTCSGCKKVETEEIDIDPNNHTGRTEIKGKKDATESAEGYTGDTYCKDCHVKLESGKTIPKLEKSEEKPEQKTDAVVTTAPKAKNLTYNGKAQKLVKAGKATGGKMQYALGKKTKATGSYSADIPTGTKAGTYYVWYKAKGDKNHNDSKAACVKVTIAEAEKEQKPFTDFRTLRLTASKRSKDAITLKWRKYADADGYLIYGGKCGDGEMKLLKTIKGNKNVTWTHKKLKKGTYYKYKVVAYKNNKGKEKTLVNSTAVHTTTKDDKRTVSKAVKVNKTKATIKKGKTFQIKASEVKDEKKKKIEHHRDICYESSNKKVATVNQKGKVKGVKKGTATIFVYSETGHYKTVKVTVE